MDRCFSACLTALQIHSRCRQETSGGNASTSRIAHLEQVRELVTVLPSTSTVWTTTTAEIHANGISKLPRLALNSSSDTLIPTVIQYARLERHYRNSQKN
ncbi:hypothetical protein KC19_11G035100 [Ceratodon purpureus]|uniref:Uncharacterized protein n=1 Tax=Ceratodon purpureus TaxID=3225 RepID=A0A8T0GDN6_CERPU|nr:hypothetical protein KC19_11G035100 [Ceratodon purpureus]